MSTSGSGDVSHPATDIRLICGADLLESFAVPGLWAEKDVSSLLTTRN